MIFYARKLTHTLSCGIIRPQTNSPDRHSYPERRRDRPCDASTTDRLYAGYGANSGRRTFWEMRGQPCPNANCPLESEWAILISERNWNNEQFIHDFTQTAIHF